MTATATLNAHHMPPGWLQATQPPSPAQHTDPTPAARPRRREQARTAIAAEGHQQTAGERVLASLMALGDREPLCPDYQRAIGDVLKVLTQNADECHREGYR